MKVFYILLACLCFVSLDGGEPPIEAVRKIPGVASADLKEKIDLIQVKFDNGMQLWMKQTADEDSEISFQVAALGGFASLVSDDPLAGEFAVQLARESGMGGMSSEEFTTLLYDNSLEFEPKIEPFSRMIYADGEASSIGLLMKIVGKLFTSQKFSKDAWKEAQVLTKDSFAKLIADDEFLFQRSYLFANTQNMPIFGKVTSEDLKRANFDTSKKVFTASFSNPAEFVCVVVGHFDPVQITKYGVEHLGAIPKLKGDVKFDLPFRVSFPAGVSHRTLRKGIRQSGVMTHMTFPLKINVDAKNVHEVAFACQLIEANLRKVITEKMKISYGVDVSYEFPLFPYLESPWMAIRFGSDDRTVERMTVIILKELTRMMAEGVTASEVEVMKKLEEGSQEFWLQDNSYWGSMLTNYYFWGWNPEGIDYKNTSLKQYSKETMDPFLRSFISLNNYSVFSAYPK